MVKYQMFKPQAVLREYIKFFWSLEAEVDPHEPFVHRALPDNCLELIFYCKGKLSISSLAGSEGYTFTSGLFGQAQKFRQFKTDADFGLFGVYLYPYSLKHLFNMPADALTNEKVDSKTLWGIEGEVLEEQVMLAPSTEERLQIVSEFFLGKIRSLQKYERAFLQRIREVADSNIIHPIASFAHDCSLSRRQFERRFRELSGFSPKDFFDLVRFKNAINEMEKEALPLAQIAINAGYYDQSHFTNEFKKLSGYTPKEFVLNHHPETDTRATRDFKD